MKALGAAAASSGAVAMFHAVGLTPEAPSLEAALAGRAPERKVGVTIEGLRAAREELGPGRDGHPIVAVSIGTPHASADELARLARLVGEHGEPAIPCYVNTGRGVMGSIADLAATLTASGITIVTDTCTYITPILRAASGLVMTDSAKWAW